MAMSRQGVLGYDYIKNWPKIEFKNWPKTEFANRC